MSNSTTEADIRWAVGNAKRLERENIQLRAENDRLKERAIDAEQALDTWDDEKDSRYWMKYPVRLNQQSTTDKP